MTSTDNDDIGAAMDPDSDAPIALIAPAMAIGSRFYTPVVRAFDTHGWDAHVLPRRGFERGQPRAARGHDWSYGDEIDTITDAVTRIRRRHPARPVIVLGHSLGAQLAAGQAINQPGVDGLVTIGGCLPHHRHFAGFGLHVAAMAAMIPALTTAFGYLPPPAFGAPGARTMMREWARMALTGRPPFPTERAIDVPALVVALENDSMAPESGVDDFARRLFAPGTATRWDYRTEDVPPGASNGHIDWVRTPQPVVDRIVTWWKTATPPA
ncbi:alpha/beta fold hydrolase [Nocardia sp. AG03]|uniref:alpha/beta fold hydrolase n=1 Tax=Nocardia sp. AG03 TaxID=3025312 RepID=UPI0024188890|nr:alpha/beta fold hydrolase [Nocardia sp. AG03]